MLECILLAGTVMFHATHQPDVGVSISGTAYEMLLPRDSTVLSILSKPGDTDIKVRFSPISGYPFLVTLHDPPNEFSLVKFVETCPTEVYP